MHDFPLITLLAAAFTAAWLLGLATQRLGLSPIVGYLLAGVAIGPYTPGFVGDATLAPQLAELGVILLMFGVGLHFHFKDLLAVRKIAVPGAIGQSLAATGAGVAVFALFGWPVTSGLVTGIAMSVASTVVLMRVLMDRGKLDTPAGHAAVGWLIVEDIITVIVLVLIPAIAAAGGDSSEEAGAGRGWFLSLLLAVGKLTVLVAIIAFAGSRIVPWILVRVASLKSRELFTLTVLVLSIAVATGSAVVFGASVALGAFLAGMVVAQSPVSQQAGAEALPLRDAFAVLFFVSVGMLFEPRFVIDHPLLVLAGLAIVLLAKPLAALIIVAALGHPARTAITVAIGLAQIGEFSFIVSELATKHGILPPEGRQLLIACALVSITLNPLLFGLAGPAERWLATRPRLWKLLNGRFERRATAGNNSSTAAIAASSDPLALVVGYGPVGQHVERLLRQAGRQTVVIELNMETVRRINAEGGTAIFGDAARAELLEQAGAARATHIVLTSSSAIERGSIIAAAKQINPGVRLLVRTHYLTEESDAKAAGADSTVVDELESAVALTELVLAETGAPPAHIKAETARVREQLSAAQTAPSPAAATPPPPPTDQGQPAKNADR